MIFCRLNFKSSP